MMEVRLFDKIRDSVYWDKIETWRKQGKRLPISLKDLGFGIVHEFIPTTKEDIRLDAKFKEEHNKIFNCDDESQDSNIIHGYSKEVSEYLSGVHSFMYKDFVKPKPGYYEKTIDWAKSHIYMFEKPIAKGALLYYSYPISGVAVFETLNDIVTSVDLMEAFCLGYKTIYEVNAKLPSAFGVWGHSIKDLVMEKIEMFNDGQDITFSIGS